MTERDSLIEKYYHHRFFETKDVEGNDLAVVALKKLQLCLSSEELLFYEKLDRNTRQIIDILSQEDDDLTSTDVDNISKYKVFADNENIPSKYRNSMYNLLIDVYQRYGGAVQDFVDILDKKLDVISTKDSSDMKYIELSANRWKRLISKDVWEKLTKKIEQKKNNSDSQKVVEKSTRLDDKKVAEQLKAREEFNFIWLKLRKEDLPFKEQVTLMERSLDIVSKIGYRRRKTYSLKSQICDKLSQMYSYAMDTDTAEYYSEERDKYIKLMRNIDKYSQGKRRGGKEF